MAETNTTKNRPAFRNVKRRDELLEMEHKVRRWRDESRVFESDAKDQPLKTDEKFFKNFPVPYTNEFLHSGDAFSLSKLEIASSFHHIRGVNVLLPFGFHCTGMPNKASTDKLRKEKEKFGYPPCFPSKEKTSDTNPTPDETSYYSRKFKGKKSKAAAKNWQGNLPVGDYEGLRLNRKRNSNFLGSDPMVKMRELKEYEKIEKAFRYTIYSLLDGPETMYGQTNAWVLPDGKYGAFKINEWEGTGILTSVPSDSPDDFIALQNLKSKALFRAMFGVLDDWVLPFEVISIINHPEFDGSFYARTMIAGEHARTHVQDAKSLIGAKLLELKLAVVYSEPEKKVMSRSGNECVVALTDQWYLTYGESS
nr:hypothetical protein [Tanacetum cinerariifolium]